MSAKPGPVRVVEEEVSKDFGDPSTVAARNRKLKGRDSRIENGLKLVMGHPDSRAWLFDLLEQMKPLNEAFTGNSTTFYNCGQQSIGKRLLVNLMDKHLDEFVTMNKEAKANAD